jgi:hypothetical protein
MTRCNSRRSELIAKGHVQQTPDMLRSNVYLPPDVFDRIRSLAIDDGMSFSATIRGLIADGLAARAREAA